MNSVIYLWLFTNHGAGDQRYEKNLVRQYSQDWLSFREFIHSFDEQNAVKYPQKHIDAISKNEADRPEPMRQLVGQ